jgi:hypothetical protein
MPRTKIEIEGILNPSGNDLQKNRLKELRLTLKDPKAAISVTHYTLAQLLRCGHPRFFRDILNPGKFVPRIDPDNPKRFLLNGKEYNFLRKITRNKNSN